MTTQAGTPVVVGVDGSARSLDAVDRAAAQAASHRRPLRVVHAMNWPTVRVMQPPGVTGAPPLPFQEQAGSLVSDAVRHAGKAVPELEVTGEVRTGPAVPVLMDESLRAYRIVIGDRGLGGFTGLLAGSVAVQMAAHGACPIVVIRGGHRLAGPVVVGVDGSSTSARALDFAAEEAALRAADLVAVHTWLTPPLVGPVGTMPLAYDPLLMAVDEHRVLAEALAGTADRYPDVPIREVAVPGSAARVLRDWSRSAQLLVVGSRGHGGFAGLLLGSVGQHLIHHAACPVAVVRTAG
jgi:nucleotide-binding universal stress UspA family protein